MAIYAIGDLHGCVEPLKRLLERIDFDPAEDRLWFTGDLVNRGPASLATLRFVYGLRESAVTVLGNHDLHLLATAWAGSRALRKRDTFEDVLAAPDRDELLEWLGRRPLLHHDAVAGYAMVHAGLPPQWSLDDARAAAVEIESVLASGRCVDFLEEMYGNQPDRWTAELQGTDRLRFIVNAFTRLRYLRPDGSLDFNHNGPPERAGPELIPWFRFPGRRTEGLSMVFGHWAAVGGVAHAGAICLETGCVWGGRLTALRLDDAVRTWVECGPGVPLDPAD